jgi:ABC-type Mn2+/Zn2+ transport system permease subunit
VAFSFVLDLPTGATIVATFGVALLLLAVVRQLVRRPAAA